MEEKRLITKDSKYGWAVITLGGITNLFAIGIPMMCMPVLFKQISLELNLSLVQVGAVWGMGGLASTVMSPFGGLIGDRFGSKRTIMIGCLLIGIAGAARGVSTTFFGLAAGMFFYGLFQNSVILNTHKTSGIWFSGKNVVMANGIVSLGIAMGMFMGALISDTVMSPLLGGWRNVLLFYGGVSFFMGLLWIFTRSEPVRYEENRPAGPPPFRRTIANVIPQKTIWIFGLAHFCYIGSIMGIIGYLPLYLSGIGWDPARADGALAALNAAGMAGAIPASLLAARLGLRKGYIMATFLITMISAGLIPLLDGFLIWPLAILIGLMRDGYFAVLMTMVIESRGIGPIYAGTAMGIIFSFGNLGSFISSPLGNRLAAIRPEFAFVFWASLMAVSFFIFHFIRTKKETV